MTLASVPWLELTLLVPLLGAIWIGWVRNQNRAAQLSLALTGVTLVCAGGAWWWVSFVPGAGESELATRLFGSRVLQIDGLSGLLLLVVSLLHFLTTLATARTKMARLPFAWLLVVEAIQLAVFACRDPWALGVLLTLGTVPPFVDLLQRGKSTRVYVLHMGLFIGLLMGGLAAEGTEAAAPLLMAAVLVRSGTFPVHVWVTDLFENAAFATALLFMTPLTGMYAAVRLVLPAAPDWVLQGIGVASLVTAIYAAGMAIVQKDARRFFAFLFLSHASLVLVGLELHTTVSLTGALALWGAVSLSIAGLGLTLRALEARFGRLTLSEYRGLYGHAPALAVCFMLTGLASVGFPGTLGFVAMELLVDGAIGVNPAVGLVVVVAAALSGIALLRVYFLLFTGAKHTTGVSLAITPRERYAVLALAALILGGGVLPQYHIESRHKVAASLLKQRNPGEVSGHH